MATHKTVSRDWEQTDYANGYNIRTRFQRRGPIVEQFVVQLEFFWQNEWRPYIRYDNAHGFPHRDLIHPDGRKEKTLLEFADLNEAFTWALNDVKKNWAAYKALFLEEASHD